jgi:hypothetical protein
VRGRKPFDSAIVSSYPTGAITFICHGQLALRGNTNQVARGTRLCGNYPPVYIRQNSAEQLLNQIRRGVISALRNLVLVGFDQPLCHALSKLAASRFRGAIHNDEKAS